MQNFQQHFTLPKYLSTTATVSRLKPLAQPYMAHILAAFSCQVLLLFAHFAMLCYCKNLLSLFQQMFLSCVFCQFRCCYCCMLFLVFLLVLLLVVILCLCADLQPFMLAFLAVFCRLFCNFLPFRTSCAFLFPSLLIPYP